LFHNQTHSGGLELHRAARFLGFFVVYREKLVASETILVDMSVNET